MLLSSRQSLTNQEGVSWLLLAAHPFTHNLRDKRTETTVNNKITQFLNVYITSLSLHITVKPVQIK